MVTAPNYDRLSGRNGAIWRGYCSGKTQEALAQEHGISQTRVSQVLASVKSSIPAVDMEEQRVKELEFLDKMRELAIDMVVAPLPPTFSQRGMILTDREDRDVLDPSGRIAAINLAMKVSESRRKFLGQDAPVKVEANHTVTPPPDVQALLHAAKVREEEKELQLRSGLPDESN